MLCSLFPLRRLLNGCFFHFFPVGASQAREFPIATTTTSKRTVRTTFEPVSIVFLCKISQIPCSLNVFTCFCNGFLQRTVIYTFVAIKPFQSIMFDHVSNSLISPNLRKYRYLHCVLQFVHVPLPLANSNIHARYPSKTLFFTLFLQCFPANTWQFTRFWP